jgi:hypothetical protein
MILDSLLRFSNAQAITATAVSDNVIDLGVTSGIPSSANGGGARDIGIGDDPAMKLLVIVGTTFLTLTSLTVALQGAVDDGTGVPAAFSTWWSSPAVVAASLVAGARLYDMDMPRPPQGIAIPRFLRMNYTVGGSNATAGTLNSYIVLDRDDQFYSSTNNAVQGGYPAGITVAN